MGWVTPWPLVSVAVLILAVAAKTVNEGSAAASASHTDKPLYAPWSPGTKTLVSRVREGLAGSVQSKTCPSGPQGLEKTGDPVHVTGFV